MFFFGKKLIPTYIVNSYYCANRYNTFRFGTIFLRFIVQNQSFNAYFLVPAINYYTFGSTKNNLYARNVY